MAMTVLVPPKDLCSMTDSETPKAHEQTKPSMPAELPAELPAEPSNPPPALNNFDDEFPLSLLQAVASIPIATLLQGLAEAELAETKLAKAKSPTS
ncbi:hypothetical protein BGZ76_005801 [Entomortierella beljakovae]|nr:hypothetical protein BGZ76_005801 [Entomortierella beljakovae]